MPGVSISATGLTTSAVWVIPEVSISAMGLTTIAVWVMPGVSISAMGLTTSAVWVIDLTTSALCVPPCPASGNACIELAKTCSAGGDRPGGK